MCLSHHFLFSFQQSQENSPQSLLRDRVENRSTSESKSESSKHLSDAVDMKFCDGKGIRLIITLS